MIKPKTELFVFGSGGHAKVALNLMHGLSSQNVLKIVTQDRASLAGAVQKWPDIQVLTQTEFDSLSFFDSRTQFHVAVGDNSIRLRLAELALSKGMKPLSIIASTAVISHLANLGEGIFIGPHSHVGPGATVGDFSIINTLANLEHDSIMGRFSHLAPGSCVCGDATIGEGAFVGANAVVKEQAGLGRWSTLGALSYLNTNHSEQNSLLVGVPARVLGEKSG